MIEFHKIKDFFEKLEFDVEIEKYQNQNRILCDIVININKEKVYANVRTEIRPNNTFQFVELSKNHSPLLAVADYITPKAKEFLKEEMKTM